MKILYAVHYFLPFHQAGTEIYTAGLARAMEAGGNQVAVFTSEDGPPAAARFRLDRDQWGSIPVHRLLRGEPPDFERSYADPEIDRIFRGLLEEIEPDAVHFQHLFRLSAGMIEECKKAGVRAVVTLADYWFICPPILLLQPGFEPCPGPEPDRCARCGNAIGALYSGAPGSGMAASDNPLMRAGGGLVMSAADRAVRSAHWLKRRLPAGMMEWARRMKQARELSDPESSFMRRREMLTQRREKMKQALAAADLVIAPSAFLKRAVIEAGAVAPEKIIHSDYGFDHSPFRGRGRGPHSGPVRFGFIGTPVEHKGLHVAIRAMKWLEGADAELTVHGDLTWFPAYARRLKSLAEGAAIRFEGRFEHQDIADILEGIDVLIVPSLWYENSPLTIHEAFMAGVPVLVSDLGGMAELVETGGGMTFRAGDHRDLAEKMRLIVENGPLLERLVETIPGVKTIEQDAADLERVYRGEGVLRD